MKCADPKCAKCQAKYAAKKPAKKKPAAPKPASPWEVVRQIQAGIRFCSDRPYGGGFFDD